MKAIWIGAMVLLAAAGLAACSGTDSTSPGNTGLGGNWRFQELLANATVGVSCTDSAQVAVTQTGPSFTANYVQTGTCSSNGQLFDNSGTGTIADGRVAGDSVSFSEDTCGYRGVLSGNPANAMAGAVVCTDSTGQALVSGNWTMNR